MNLYADCSYCGGEVVERIIDYDWSELQAGGKLRGKVEGRCRRK